MDEVVALFNPLLSCCAGLLGVLIGGFVSILTTWLTIRKERQEWDRKQKAERQRWARNELRQIYSKCLYYVSHSNLQSNIPSECPEDMSLEEYTRLVIESKRIDDEINRARHEWFNLLLLYYPDRHSEVYNNFVNKIREGEKTSYEDVLGLALEDPRLKDDINLLVLSK